MDFTEWQKLKTLDSKLLDWTYYNKSHYEMKLFNEKNGTVKTEVHHLMNTEEQINYNKRHYELWGYNLDGTFEYGKYVIFVTRSEHAEIHASSEISNIKRSESMKEKWKDPNYRQKLEHIHSSDEYRQRMSKSLSGSGHPNYGKSRSIEIIEKIRAAINTPDTIAKLRESSAKIWKGKHRSDEDKLKMSLAKRGKKLSDEHKKHIGDAHKGTKHTYKTDESRNRVISGVIVNDELKQQMSNVDTCNAICSSILNTIHNIESLNIDSSKSNKYSLVYKQYKNLGGIYKWNEFRYIIKCRPDLFDQILSMLSI